VLAGCLAAAAALAGLSVPFGVPWLAAAGLIVAAVAALAGLVIIAARARLEGRRERAESVRRLRVAPITEVDPTLIGVDKAAPTVLPGATLPDYLPRGVDTGLRDVIAAALAGRGDWLVVVVGGSKVGKSRTLFEALRRCALAGKLQLVAPVDGDALRSLLDPGQAMPIRAEYAVLWLDDLELFLNEGVTLRTLREWQSGGPGRIVAATYGGKGSELIAGSAIGGLTTIATDVLQHARQISLNSTSTDELAPLRGRLPEAEFETVRRHGLAAYLVAGPALQNKLFTGRHAPGAPACPEGVAVVYTAVDWARCGRTDPISDTTLRQLWSTHLPAGIAPTDDGFGIGLDWALRPVAATIALLHRTGGYQAYDYVIRLVREQPGAAPPRDPVWAAAIDTATATEAFAVAVAAYTHARLADAATAFNRARDSSITELAALAGYNLGVMLGRLGRSADTLAAYQQVITDYGDDPAPALRERVAGALYNTGVVLGRLGRSADALAAYQQVITDYGDDPAPALRERVAKALVNQGVALGKLGRPADALAAYQQVVDRYGDDPALRERVAAALVNQGVALGMRGRPADALAAYQQVITDYGDDPAPALREQVAKALYNTGIALRALGRPADALAAYQQVITDYGDDPAPALREAVARATAALQEAGDGGRSD